MKLKKMFAVILIIITLFNLISRPSFADDENAKVDIGPQETGQATVTNDSGKNLMTSITGTTYSKSGIFKSVAFLLTLVPHAANQLMESFVEVTSNDKMSKFTIYDTVLGHYDLFNLNYLEIPKTLDLDKSTAIQETYVMNQIKYHVIQYYTIIRNFSIAVSLFVLIYIGIRMAISTVAEDKAKYKEMLINWIVSIILVFLLQFIVIIISFVLKYGLNLVNNIASAWGLKEFESQIYSGAIKNLTTKGFNVFTSVVIIYILTWYQVKFFIYYMRRTLEVNFLIMVSQLVTITYQIDKAGDGKAQAFGTFMQEIIMKSVIQIIHAILYVVFLGTAGVIASNMPIVAILFFAALSRAEKITRNIFTVKEDGFQKADVPVKLPFIKH